MEAKTNYTVVGIIVLILIAALISAGLWLSVGFGKKKYSIYEVHVHEAVSGLGNEAVVKFNGVPVGQVYKIELNQANPQEVQLLLNIEQGTPITTSTSATLISQGITGTTYVGLSASSPDLTLLKRKPNQRYPIIPTKPSLLNQLDHVLKEVSDNVNKVSVQVKRVFDKENVNYIKKTLANFKQTSDTIAQNSKRIDSSLKSLDIFLKNSAQLSQQFPAIVTDLKEGVHSLKVMAKSVNNAGNKVAGAMESGKVAIDKISQQTLPSALSLLHKLDTIAANLEKMSVQVRQNPSVILRGSQPPVAGPGE